MNEASSDELALSSILMVSQVYREESEESFLKNQSLFITGLMSHFALEDAIFPVLQEADESKASVIQELIREHEVLLNQITDLEHQPKNAQSDRLFKKFIVALLSHASREDEEVLTINIRESQLKRIDELAKPLMGDPDKKHDTNFAE